MGHPSAADELDDALLEVEVVETDRTVAVEVEDAAEEDEVEVEVAKVCYAISTVLRSP